MNKFLFFFQAEDGIRDSVASRGLGDVYKRQLLKGRVEGRNRDVNGAGDPKWEEQKKPFEHDRQIFKKARKNYPWGPRL